MIEHEVAKVTTHTLTTDGQMPGWVAHFEPRKAWWPEYQWRQEMRKIAIEDGSRFGWADAPTRGSYSASGAYVSLLRCVETSYGTQGASSGPFVVSSERSFSIDGREMIHINGDTVRRYAIPDAGTTQRIDLMTLNSLVDLGSGYRFEQRSEQLPVHLIDSDFSREGVVLNFIDQFNVSAINRRTNCEP